MDVVSIMHRLQAIKDLPEHHQCRLESELSATQIEQVLKTGTKQVHHDIDDFIFDRDSLLDESWESIGSERLVTLNLLQ